MYAHIKFKLVSITSAYFEQKDFSKTEILVNSFNSLTHLYDLNNSSLFSDLALSKKETSNSSSQQYLVGLSLGDLVLRYQHKILVLFKLLLLEKKVLFQLKPVSNLSNTIMSLVSLLPGVFDANCDGLKHCSGFFDSIDLVNCELERKTNKSSNGSDVPSSPTCGLFTQSLDSNSNGRVSSKQQKKLMKKKSKKLSKKLSGI